MSSTPKVGSQSTHSDNIPHDQNQVQPTPSQVDPKALSTTIDINRDLLDSDQNNIIGADFELNLPESNAVSVTTPSPNPIPYTPQHAPALSSHSRHSSTSRNNGSLSVDQPHALAESPHLAPRGPTASPHLHGRASPSINPASSQKRQSVGSSPFLGSKKSFADTVLSSFNIGRGAMSSGSSGYGHLVGTPGSSSRQLGYQNPLHMPSLSLDGTQTHSAKGSGPAVSVGSVSGRSTGNRSQDKQSLLSTPQINTTASNPGTNQITPAGNQLTSNYSTASQHSGHASSHGKTDHGTFTTVTQVVGVGGPQTDPSNEFIPETQSLQSKQSKQSSDHSRRSRQSTKSGPKRILDHHPYETYQTALGLYGQDEATLRTFYGTSGTSGGAASVNGSANGKAKPANRSNSGHFTLDGEAASSDHQRFFDHTSTPLGHPNDKSGIDSKIASPSINGDYGLVHTESNLSTMRDYGSHKQHHHNHNHNHHHHNHNHNHNNHSHNHNHSHSHHHSHNHSHNHNNSSYNPNNNHVRLDFSDTYSSSSKHSHHSRDSHGSKHSASRRRDATLASAVAISQTPSLSRSVRFSNQLTIATSLVPKPKDGIKKDGSVGGDLSHQDIEAGTHSIASTSSSSSSRQVAGLYRPRSEQGKTNQLSYQHESRVKTDISDLKLIEHTNNSSVCISPCASPDSMLLPHKDDADDNSSVDLNDSDEENQPGSDILYSINGHLKYPPSEHLRYEYVRNDAYHAESIPLFHMNRIDRHNVVFEQERLLKALVKEKEMVLDQQKQLLGPPPAHTCGASPAPYLGYNHELTYGNHHYGQNDGQMGQHSQNNEQNGQNTQNLQYDPFEDTRSDRIAYRQSNRSFNSTDRYNSGALSGKLTSMNSSTNGGHLDPFGSESQQFSLNVQNSSQNGQRSTTTTTATTTLPHGVLRLEPINDPGDDEDEDGLKNTDHTNKNQSNQNNVNSSVTVSMTTSSLSHSQPPPPCFDVDPTQPNSLGALTLHPQTATLTTNASGTQLNTGNNNSPRNSFNLKTHNNTNNNSDGNNGLTLDEISTIDCPGCRYDASLASLSATPSPYLDSDGFITYGDDEFAQPTSLCDFASRAELYSQLHLAIPLILSFGASYGVGLVNLSFQGHIDDGGRSLAAAAIALFYQNLSGTAVLYGLNAGIDSFGSQYFGAGAYKMVGLIGLRGATIGTLAMLLVIFFWWFTAAALAIFGIDPEISQLAQDYCRICTFSLPAILYLDVLRRVLEVQQICIPSMVVNIIGVIGVAPLNWFFMDWLDLGFLGPAYSYIIINYCMFFALLAYFFASGISKLCLPSATTIFSMALFQNWGQYLSIALPSVGAIAGEWLAFELQTVVAARLHDTSALAAQSLITSLNAFVYNVPMSLGIAASCRIGAFLGARKPSAAILGYKTALRITWVSQLIMAVILWTFKTHIIRLFTGIDTVVTAAETVMPLLALFVIADGFQGMLQGVMRAMSAQMVGFLANVSFFWAISLPLSVWFTLHVGKHDYGNGEKQGMGLLGIWISLLVGSSGTMFSYLTFLGCSSWSKRTNYIYSMLMREEEQNGELGQDAAEDNEDEYGDGCELCQLQDQHFDGQHDSSGYDCDVGRSNGNLNDDLSHLGSRDRLQDLYCQEDDRHSTGFGETRGVELMRRQGKAKRESQQGQNLGQNPYSTNFQYLYGTTSDDSENNAITRSSSNLNNNSSLAVAVAVDSSNQDHDRDHEDDEERGERAGFLRGLSSSDAY